MYPRIDNTRHKDAKRRQNIQRIRHQVDERLQL